MFGKSRLLSIAALAGGLVGTPARADRNTLWHLVHDLCAPRQRAGEAPKPCELVDLSNGEEKGAALLKDREGIAQYLAIPTRKITGIEDPSILSPDAPNYFAFAWGNRAKLDAKVGAALPREAVAIAVNSAFARSQDLLHLHIDCLRPDVMATLAADAKTFDDTWRAMAEPLNGRVYVARRLLSTDLSDAKPFELLASGVEGAKDHMNVETLAVVGATFEGKPGFVLLADHAELAAGGHAEDIEDHTCAVAKR